MIRVLISALLLPPLLLCPDDTHALGSRNSAAVAEMKSFAGAKSGVVVWQSRRSGPFRIFACGLDGSGLRQLTPDVSGKDHIAPMISPDGKKVIYYQTPAMSESSYYDDHVGEMMMVNASDTKGNATTLVNEVRTFFECRFARWIDNSTIAYIGKDHDTYTYSLSSKTSTKLFNYPLTDFGAIPNRQLTHAIDGKNRVFELKSGTASQKQDYDGCEGNMSDDGLWAYRVKATSHDFTRMKLDSWSEEAFFQNHDSALPSGQNYIYFPQISPCQRYLAFGASADKHNHYTSDYDIFVVPIDAKTFKKTGKAVKYSFHGSLDAYPDIWVAPDTPGLTTITVTTTNTFIQPNDKIQITAELKDQSGAPFKAVVSWSVSGGGTVAPTSSGTSTSNTTTVFQSDGTTGQFTVTATADGISGDVTLEVSNIKFPLKINCGSNDHDASGWSRDDAFVSGGADWTNPNVVDTSGVTDAAPAEVYRSVRHQSPHSYDLPVPDGKYRLRLHFADAYDNGRSMTYKVEGVEVLTNLDVASKAGGTNKALVEQMDVTVSDGNGLQIEATGTDDVFEAGLELEVLSITKPPIEDGGPPAQGDGPSKQHPDGGPSLDMGVGSSLRRHLGGGCEMSASAGGGQTTGVVVLLLFLVLGLCRIRRRRD